MNLKIQCPKCSKRFTIHEDLTGKMVECGSCNHRFPVKPEAIIPARKTTFPKSGNQDEFLSRLGKQPAAEKRHGSGGAEVLPRVDAIMPASAAQTIAAGAGVALMILYGLLFFLGTGKGGVFQDVTMIKRIVLASFVGIVGFSLTVYGAKKWRLPAILFSLVLVGGLAALTAIRPVLTTPAVTDIPVPVREPEPAPEDEEMTEDRIRLRVGYQAVERKLRALEDEYGADAPDYLLAIYVEDLATSQFYNLQRYFARVFAIPDNEGVSRYKRNQDQDSLLVISGIKINFDEAVRVCDPRLGRVTTYPELRLIDLKLSAVHSTEVSEDLREKLRNPRHRSFFATNLKELGALNPSRVADAVRSLSMVPESVELRYQEEILVELMRLLRTETDEEFRKDLARAFRRWGADNRAAQTAVSRQVEAWLKEGEKFAPEFVEYLIENEEPKGLAIVDQLWSKEPESWILQYSLVGSRAEPILLEHLEESPMRLKLPAAQILASVGTEQSLPVLQKYLTSSSQELRILADRAIKAIQAR